MIHVFLLYKEKILFSTRYVSLDMRGNNRQNMMCMISRYTNLNVSDVCTARNNIVDYRVGSTGTDLDPYLQ